MPRVAHRRISVVVAAAGAAVLAMAPAGAGSQNARGTLTVSQRVDVSGGPYVEGSVSYLRVRNRRGVVFRRSRAGRIEAPLGRDRRDPTRQSLDTDSPRDAITHFELDELLPRHSLLRVRLETGRMHQIRVHLAAVNLPVAGDPVYGIANEVGLERQFLHAARLSFAHPITGQRVDVSSPLPNDLATALERAR